MIVRNSGTTKMYLNNVETTSTASSANIQNYASEVWIGGNWQADEMMVDNGRIAHFSIYNKALSTDERTQNFNGKD